MIWIRVKFASHALGQEKKVANGQQWHPTRFRGTIPILSTREGWPPTESRSVHHRRLSGLEVKTHSNGMMVWFRGMISIKRARARSPYEANHNATAARLSYCWIDSIGDKLFAILKSLIILSILDGSGHIYMGFVLKWLYVYGHISFYNGLFLEQLATCLFYLNWHILHEIYSKSYRLLASRL